MSVWPHTLPTSPSLTGSEGELVSVWITVEPRFLESLLEALARVDFPINPQIYHDAGMVDREARRGEGLEPLTLVEFPAYAGRLDGVRQALAAYGFDAARVKVVSMLEELRSPGRARRTALGG